MTLSFHIKYSKQGRIFGAPEWTRVFSAPYSKVRYKRIQQLFQKRPLPVSLIQTTSATATATRSQNKSCFLSVIVSVITLTQGQLESSIMDVFNDACSRFPRLANVSLHSTYPSAAYCRLKRASWRLRLQFCSACLSYCSCATTASLFGASEAMVCGACSCSCSCAGLYAMCAVLVSCARMKVLGLWCRCFFLTFDIFFSDPTLIPSRGFALFRGRHNK